VYSGLDNGDGLTVQTVVPVLVPVPGPACVCVKKCGVRLFLDFPQFQICQTNLDPSDAFVSYLYRGTITLLLLAS